MKRTYLLYTATLLSLLPLLSGAYAYGQNRGPVPHTGNHTVMIPLRDSGTRSGVNAPASIAVDGNPLSAGKFAGTVSVTAVELAEQGDSLSLTMEFVVERDAVNRRQSLAVVPQLEAVDANGIVKTLTFPYALVNGRINEKLYRRRMRFGNEELLSNPPYVRTVVSRHTYMAMSYTVWVPYRMWMDDANLQIHGILVSPAGKRQLFTVRDAGRVKLAPHTPYEVSPQVNFIEPEREQKQRRVQGQAFLEFQAGRSVILPAFRRNPVELSKVSDIVLRVKNDPDVHITGIYIEGYASPEGNSAVNERLSGERAAALRDYLVREFGLDASLFRVSAMGEDWAGFRALAEENVPKSYRERLLAIIDSGDTPDVKESRIRALGGNLWQVLTAEIFPSLRRVEYRIDFSVNDYTVEQSRSQLERNPELLSQRELFLLAQSYPEGSPERDVVFDLIGRMWPDDVVASVNTAAVMLLRGENIGAGRVLKSVENDPRAFNNLGVYYLMTGDLDTAEGYFAKAAAEGIPEAQHNLGEVKRKRADNEIMKRHERQ